MAAIDHATDQASAESARDRLREQARALGMRLVSFTVTEDPIPDPALDSLPPADLRRIAAISRDMHARPQRHVAELERLTAEYPHIPMLFNHLAGALEAAGQRDRAVQIISETARRFPTYIFAFCNHVMMLVSQGKIEEARSLVETGPRGPIFTLVDFDPMRDTFHISEAISHAAMVGHYMLATGRRGAAEAQLKMLRESAADSPQYRSLAAAMGRTDDLLELAAALLRIAAERDRHKVRPTKRARTPRANRKTSREGGTAEHLVIEDSNPGLFDQ